MNSIPKTVWTNTNSERSDLQPAKVLDREIIGQLIADIGPKATASLIDIYAAEARTLVNVTNEALQNGQTDLAATKAHGLKGSSATFGARQLAETADQVERCCLNGECTKAQDIVVCLPNLLDITLAALTEISQRCNAEEETAKDPYRR